ncbi:hypothetical protein [Streptomyces sp. NPDC059743]|uniref:hypothetical protein n=1 Tax=Streptomyces sp. NPDC059743 TaxID=3346928 RepID=UPI0036558CE7
MTYDWDRLTGAERNAARHSPDHAASVRTSEESWAEFFDVRKALAAADTLDQSTLPLFTDRMTAAWLGRQEGQKSVEARGFAVWDYGLLGYWHRERLADPGRNPAGALMRRLLPRTSCVPPLRGREIGRLCCG